MVKDRFSEIIMIITCHFRGGSSLQIKRNSFSKYTISFPPRYIFISTIILTLAQINLTAYNGQWFKIFEHYKMTLHIKNKYNVSHYKLIYQNNYNIINN